MKRSNLAIGLALAGLLATLTSAPAQATGDPERGAYLAAISDCGGCHTPGAMTPQPDIRRPMAGNTIGFAIPELGIFYPPNLTPDIATDLGAWTEDPQAGQFAPLLGQRDPGEIIDDADRDDRAKPDIDANHEEQIFSERLAEPLK